MPRSIAHPILLKLLNDKMIGGVQGPLTWNLLLNLILVYHEGRRGYLFESSEYLDPEEREAAIEFVDEMAYRVGLRVVRDRSIALKEFPRRFISKALITEDDIARDELLGALLGFQCAGHEYDNQQIDRVGFLMVETKTGTEVTAEFCEAGRTTQEIRAEYRRRAEHWTEIVQMYDPRLKFKVREDRWTSKSTLVSRLVQDDFEFLVEHQNEYANILGEMISPDSKLAAVLRSGDNVNIGKSYLAIKMLILGVDTTIQSDDYMERYRADPEFFQQELCDFEDRIINATRLHVNVLP
eukprot:GILJ01021745.1.p1 GENE.GILJ01021745.1~~GILJ01021745.1.p1  ORF type:complete len:296 (-),score=37.36 GILJ01021745.1:415-1302(-)